MNSIQTQSFPREKKRFLLLFLICSLAFTSAAFGGTFLVYFQWPNNFHPFTNSAGSATIDAEWIVYPNGLAPENDFYLTSTTPHMANGNEVLFRYFNGVGQFLVYGMFDMYLHQAAAQPYIGARVLLGETRSVMRYRFTNVRTTGPAKVKLTCNNQAATIAAASNGASLPQSTIYVTGTYTFPSSGTIQVISSAGGQNVSYTGTTSNGNGTTSFTGCTGGTGTLTLGNELNRVSGNSTTATHFENIVYLWNYQTSAWDLIADQEFDRPALCNDCTVCNNCGFWGPAFESNYNPCATGVLPPIGVVDWSVSVDGGNFVQGNTSNAVFVDNRSGCGQTTPYQLFSYIPNYQWIIKSQDDK